MGSLAALIRLEYYGWFYIFSAWISPECCSLYSLCRYLNLMAGLIFCLIFFAWIPPVMSRVIWDLSWVLGDRHKALATWAMQKVWRLSWLAPRSNCLFRTVELCRPIGTLCCHHSRSSFYLCDSQKTWCCSLPFFLLIYSKKREGVEQQIRLNQLNYLYFNLKRGVGGRTTNHIVTNHISEIH